MTVASDDIDALLKLVRSKVGVNLTSATVKNVLSNDTIYEQIIVNVPNLNKYATELIDDLAHLSKILDKYLRRNTDIFFSSILADYVEFNIYVRSDEKLNDIITLCKLKSSN